jgi:hypothetical protein
VIKRGRSWLKVDRHGRWSSKGVDCDIMSQGFNRIARILIQPRYTFFSQSPTTKNFGVKHAWSRAIFVGLVYDPRELPGVTTVRHGVTEVLQHKK